MNAKLVGWPSTGDYGNHISFGLMRKVTAGIKKKLIKNHWPLFTTGFQENQTIINCNVPSTVKIYSKPGQKMKKYLR